MSFGVFLPSGCDVAVYSAFILHHQPSFDRLVRVIGIPSFIETIWKYTGKGLPSFVVGAVDAILNAGVPVEDSLISRLHLWCKSVLALHQFECERSWPTVPWPDRAQREAYAADRKTLVDRLFDGPLRREGAFFKFGLYSANPVVRDRMRSNAATLFTDIQPSVLPRLSDFVRMVRLMRGETKKFVSLSAKAGSAPAVASSAGTACTVGTFGHDARNQDTVPVVRWVATRLPTTSQRQLSIRSMLIAPSITIPTRNENSRRDSLQLPKSGGGLATRRQ